MNRKIILLTGIFLASALILSVFWFGDMPNSSYAQTQQDCHTFSANLRVGSQGSEVQWLQKLLEKEGFAIDSNEENNSDFGESTASVVTGFQEKYRSEILTPNGLSFGTGFFGASTRAKLNKLYGCAIAADCHTFSYNLGVENQGSEVQWLQKILEKEGFAIDSDEKNNYDFGESTASAVSGFQQKYLDEILTPSGLKYGTGYVGKATRAKLNKLYGCGATASPVTSTPACNVFLTCEIGYTPQNTGEKDNQGCPVIKCVVPPASIAPVPATPVSIPTVSEQVKCLFHDSTTKQECYSSSGSNCADISACVVDVKGAKGEQITWKSTCGGYAYTTMDGNNEYAEFKCAVSAPASTQTTLTTPVPITPVPTTSVTPVTSSLITVLSPNGGEIWTGGSTQIIKWNYQNVSRVYIKLRKGSDTYPDKEGVVSNIMPNQGFYKWTIPSTLPSGNDYAIRIVDADNLNTLDDSDAPFSIVAAGTPAIPSSITVLPSTGNQLTALSAEIIGGQSTYTPWSNDKVQRERCSI